MATKHPAENLLKFLIVQDPTCTDGFLQKSLEDWGFLSADPTYLPLLRQTIPAPPANFQPANRADRASVRYLRDQEVYEFFHPNDAMHEAWDILGDRERRKAVEKVLLARLDLSIAVRKVNEKFSWLLTQDGLEMYRHAFWNVPRLTFDEWGRYMYNRTAMYDQYMALLLSSPKLAFYHLRLDQTIDSKKMIQDTQKIAYFTLLEVAQKPGTGLDKVKSIGVLSKTVIEAHNALSTSDMALKDVLKQFEHWRMEHPEILPPAIRQLAPGGNYSGTGNKASGTVIEIRSKE